MSKSRKSDNRQIEQEMRYLRRMFAEIGKDVALPPSLHGDMLRPKLDGVTPDGLKVKTPFNAGDFLRSKVFSLQSVVSYALAFVVIVAVAYAMGGGGPALVDGNIAISREAVAEDNLVQAEAFTAAPPIQSAESLQQMLPDEDTDVEEDTPESATILNDVASESSSGYSGGGVGGGAIAHPLGEDTAYNYVYRHNDRTDPDKTGYPLTIEVVSKASESVVTHIDIADMDSIEAFFLLDDAFAVTGSGDALTIARAYTLDPLAESPAAAELFALSQPGEYVDARLVDEILHLVTLQNGGDYGDLETVRMPDSLTDTACIITTADLVTGEYRQVAYLGAEEDMRISIQNRNIYIPYSGVRPADAGEDTDELYMTQIKLEGVEQEMVIVP